jgi:hypothetical protein
MDELKLSWLDRLVLKLSVASLFRHGGVDAYQFKNALSLSARAFDAINRSRLPDTSGLDGGEAQK